VSRRRRRLLAAGALLAGAAIGPLVPGAAGAAGSPSTWLAGAQALPITPPPYNAADDARDFATCNTTVFNGARLFDFEEPYVDQAGTGEFKYPDPFCDANANGRYDGLYSSGGVDHLMRWKHDDIWSRAVAISDGTSAVVMLSVTSQGLMNEDIGLIRQQVKAARSGVSEVYVSSTHNESSPDPIGIYGAPSDPSVPAGARSGIDDYYIAYLVGRSVAAAINAYDSMAPAGMRAADVQIDNVKARLSKTLPTTNDDGSPAATDGKLRVLQLYNSATHANIETILNLAAHNQQVGHAGDNQLSGGQLINRSISDDWPGVFAAHTSTLLGGGQAMFMVADNGSIEDPHMNPDTVCPGQGCYELAAATGTALGDRVVAAIAAMGPGDEIAPHAISAHRDVFDVPLQNNVFAAAFAGGLFAHRHLATDGALFGISGLAVKTEVGLVDFGPQLQVLVNPGEAFPGIALGSPWGIEDASCPNRPNPPIWAWHSSAAHRLEMGLGNDMIGYETPAWAWYELAPVYADPACPNTTSGNTDRNGHPHKLESESLGPDAANIIAQHLAGLADATPDPLGHIQPGRFIKPDGAFTRRGADAPVGMWVLPNGTSTFTPGTGTLVALDGIGNFGGHPVDFNGVFMDADGQPQAAANLDTRGMLVTAPNNTVSRYYMDPYPALSGASPGAPQPAAAVPDIAPSIGVLVAMALVGFVLRRRRATAGAALT
jgi:hypothetical protein